MTAAAKIVLCIQPSPSVVTVTGKLGSISSQEEVAKVHVTCTLGTSSWLLIEPNFPVHHHHPLLLLLPHCPHQ